MKFNAVRMRTVWADATRCTAYQPDIVGPNHGLRRVVARRPAVTRHFESHSSPRGVTVCLEGALAFWGRDPWAPLRQRCASRDAFALVTEIPCLSHMGPDGGHWGGAWLCPRGHRPPGISACVSGRHRASGMVRCIDNEAVVGWPLSVIYYGSWENAHLR